MKLALALVDVCAPDHWQGTASPFFQVAVDKTVNLATMQKMLRDEYATEMVQGDNPWAIFMNSNYIPDAVKGKYWDECSSAIFSAINAFKAKDYKWAIKDIEPSETGETIYAYIRLIDLKTGQSPELPF